jgi:hypothetical protein
MKEERGRVFNKEGYLACISIGNYCQKVQIKM